MKKPCALCLIVLFALASRGATQEVPANEEFQPLVLVRIIPVPDAEGRFDHMAVDVKRGRIFAAVYGNDTIEVMDAPRGRRIHTIQGGLNKPQGVAYIPESNRIVVSNSGDGSCKIFDGETYKLIDTVKFPEDADQLRYDPVTKRVYVGYGDGAIGMIDMTNNKRLDSDFEVGVHPESFQLEESGPRIFVNLASISQIAVIDRNAHTVTKWPLSEAGTNFPMALDETHHRLFVAARRPARLLVLDMESGKVIASLPGAADTDDMWYDATRKRIYVPASFSFTNKSILTATNASPKFPPQLVRAPARTMDRWENTTAFTSLFRVVPIKARNYGFTKRGTK